ncbi:MAG: Ig-like domain-containing protein, partial [Candidatus Marinimicrobia bacterium]|nr:Ig-like domain-containing protein [Candidatus Neomarinimicrobiota bacterium]
GLVTGESAGTATITATTEDGGYMATCEVTVTEVVVTTIVIQENESGVLSYDGSVDDNHVGYTGDGFINTVNENGVGITWEVNVTESGTYTLEWRYANGSSTNRTAQVKVDGNVVVSNVDFQPTGSWDNWDEVSIDVTLSQGTRQIRLEATNSSGLPNIDYISITLKDGGTQVVHVTGVSVEPTTASIGVGETVQLTATVEPSNATNKNVTWSSSNPSVATVSSSGLVTGESAGTATITATTEDGGYMATCEITVTEEGQGGQIAIVPDGYGRNATGGGDVEPITVSSASEFKSAVDNDDPAVIYVDGRFDLGEDVLIGSNKTIIGVGKSSGLYGGTIKIQGNNYIIANLTFGPSDGDVLEISGGTNVFITHCAFHDSKDELCSVVREADYVTISWSHFWFDNPDDHSYAHLIGNSDSRTSDRGKLHVTLHHNWYDNGVKGRQPRVRFGHVHVYNCYYSSNNTDYCIGAGKECHIRVENTYFDNVDDPFADYGGSDDGEIGWNNCVFDGCSEPDFMPNSYPVFDLPYNFDLDPVANVPSIVMNNCGPKSDLLLSKKIAYDNSKSINVIVIPETYGISNPYPNPFNPVTIFRYQLPLTSHIDIKIYDLLGKEILTLEKGMKQAGIYEVQFDGTNLQSGVYLMRFVARSEDGSEHYVQVKKMLLVK